MKVGFVLASIHTGSSNYLWPTVAQLFPQDGNNTLFVFPGGRLDKEEDFEYLRNSVYSLVNQENLDAAVCWGSSLSGTVSPQKVAMFNKTLSQIPLVTISSKIKEIPDISFDAYGGMKKLINHCITEHGAKKIAFIRGPHGHLSAQQRYQAYLDSLNENSIEVDYSLVSDPVGWNDGAKALRQLTEERGKIAGKDFDTLLCSSDLMMFDAEKVLDKKGIRIPQDLRICGFNDSHEARMLAVPCSTVRMPFYGLGVSAFKALKEILDGNENVQDVVLETKVVIRKSCGCTTSSKTGELGQSWESFSSWLAETFRLNPVQIQFIQESLEKGERELGEVISLLFKETGDVFAINNALDILSSATFLSSEYQNLVEKNAKGILAETLDRHSAQNSYETQMRSKVFNSLKCDLLCAQDLDSVITALAARCPSLGIDEAWLVMNEEDKGFEKIGGFNANGEDYEKELFSSSLILPQKIMDSICSGVFVVEPLFTENQAFGHLVLKSKVFDGSICEELRSSISSAVQGALLFEETAKAKEEAEKAQQARTEFFAGVGENLRDPLAEIASMIKSSKKVTKQEKQGILKRIMSANHMIDLALSNTGGLELDRRVEDFTHFLQSLGVNTGNKKYPALLIDHERLLEAFKLILSLAEEDEGKGVVESLVTAKGLKVTISDSLGKWRPDMFGSDAGFSLAQSIILMHGGTFAVKDRSCIITLPYPTLCEGETASVESGFLGIISKDPGPNLWVGELENEVQVVSPSVFLEKNHLPQGTGAICWDCGNGGFEDLFALRLLAENGQYKTLPFLCYSCPQARNMEDAMNLAVDIRRNGPVVLLGTPPKGFAHWAPPGDVITISNISDFGTMSLDPEPSLLVISNPELPNKEVLEEIRALKKGGRTPILIITDEIKAEYVRRICLIPNVIICNSCITESEEFSLRMRSVIAGSEILPTFTGALVKKAQAYMCLHAASPVSRWQIAGEIHVSEDYLTRIFKKELGLSPWDYLNRYRIDQACDLLVRTGMTISEIAQSTGFQDQAYFCRVFRKIKGNSPGRLRGR